MMPGKRDTGTAAPIRRVVFVCWGNICRSPMAERVAATYFAEHGLGDVELTSAATSTEEIGNPIDPRAVTELKKAGYDADDHSAHQITRDEIDENDLVVAMEDIHLDRMRDIYGGDLPDHVVLLTDYDPGAEPGDGVPDPWYGGQDGFVTTLATMERAMPALADAVRELD